MKKHWNVRRGLASLVAVGTLCAAMPTLTFSAAQTLAGDVNLDQTVTDADILQLQNYLLGTATLDGNAADNADLSGDGKLNGFDLAILKKVVGVTPISNEVSIYLSDTGIRVEGDDNNVVQISGKVAKITAGGLYHVYGDITEGQLYVETAAADTADVELELNDVTMTNSTMSCIYTSAASGSEKTKITLNGTNTLTDTAAAAYAESGVIYTNNKLTITKSSTGTLNVNSNMNTGIYAAKKMNLNGGTIVVNTADGSDTADADAIVADNALEIEGAAIDIDSSADGLKSKDEGVFLISGNVVVKAGNDAVQAVTEITISGGTLTAGGDRGFRLDEAGLLNITGGTVIATATDYQVTGAGVTVNTAGTTQTTMMLDMAAEWTKADTITIGSKTYTANKKYSYVLISDSALSASSKYNVYVAGNQMNHSTDAAGNFQNTAALTQYYNVAVMGGGTTTTTGTVATITYNGSGVTLYDASGNTVSSDSAVSVSGSEVTISKAGVYEVNGSSTSGRLVVNTDDTAEPTAIVELDLTGLTLSNSTKAPIFVENVGDECVIVAKSGSTNTISDGTSHTDTQTNSEGVTETVNGAIYACDDLKIKGTGTLIVNGNTADGIVCKNDLKLWNGDIQVTAVDDGIRGNDSVRIGDEDDTDFSTLKVNVKTTAGDGITSTNAEDADSGFVRVTGGSVTINSYGDGIQGEQAVEINGGDLNITTYQGSSYVGSGSSSDSGSTGGWGPGSMGGMEGGNTNKTDFSCKGIKAVGIYDAAGTTWQSAGNLSITGGTIKVNSTDDSLHCGGDMTLTGGVMTLQSADDAMHSDHTLNIGTSGNGNTFNDVMIYVPTAYEGVEGLNINQYSGTVYCVTTDDGYNAAGGADSSGGSWGGGGGSYALNISGGFAAVNSASGDHDGFDSNGSINMTGGYVCANGQEPADCDGTKNMSGASYITINRGGNTALTTRYTFLDGSGNVLISFMSASGGSATTTNGVSVQTGGTVSGGTQILPDCTSGIYIGGTLSGGSSSSGGNQGW